MTADIQFVEDSEGQKTAAIAPMDLYEAYEEYLIELGMARAASESRDEPTRLLEKFLAEMRAAGEIDV